MDHFVPPAFRPGILVVDDEPMVRSVLEMGLTRSGFTAWVAESGADAVALYQVHPGEIALVLLDVRMPGLDGPQTLEALRELNPHVRACFMSGDLGDHDAVDLRRRGAAFIAKPFHLSDLANLLRR